MLLTGCTATKTSVSQTREVPATPQNINPASAVDAEKVMRTAPDPAVIVAPDEVLKPKR